MQSFRRVPAGVRQGLQTASRQQSRRYAHDAHDSTHQTPPGPSAEPLGRGFYIIVALIPASLALYKLSAQGTGPDSQPAFTRMINSYDGWRAEWTRRNDLHTKAIELAAADRNLFLNSKRSSHVDIKFPEQINSGSPWNVPAGHGRANIDQAIEKYQREAYAENERKLDALRNNNVKVERPYQPPATSFAQ